ncbi:MAG TPA: hypothetical protein VE912_21320, partial [Bacteroidales bacterium]|nr:hypothetical protein [Bacteroidales bacterium]
MTSTNYSFKNSVVKFLIIFLCFFSFAQTENQIAAQKLSGNDNFPRSIQSFDANWHFHKGDVEGAQNKNFKDKGWRILDVPHDW